MRFQSRSATLLTLGLVTMFTVLCSGATQAQDTLLINYQGLLTDDQGDPVSGTPSMTFTIYDDVSVPLWTETHPTVQVSNGLFTVNLGSQTALPDSVFDGEDRYLGIRVDADDELSPRTLLTSAPGATYARQLVGDIVTGPGMLLVKDSAGSSAVVLAADPGGHAMRLHPPDPCVPPDPCAPALEMLAEVDTHILRIHPPDPCVPPEPCVPAFELIADAEVHSMKVFPPDPCTSPPCTPATRIRAGSQEVNFDLMVSTPTDDEVTPISMGSIWSPDSSIGILSIAALAVAGEDYYEESPWSIVVDRDSTFMTFSRTDPASGTNPKVKVVATSSASTLTIRGEDPISDVQSIAMVAGPEGARVGIGTGVPAEALDVVGTAEMDGFKMETGAANGYVLTSDGEGTGTWQALSGQIGSACAGTEDLTVDDRSQVRITFPVTFSNASNVDLAASVIVVSAATGAGFPARVTGTSVTETYAELTLESWNGSSYSLMARDEIVQLSYTAIEL